MADNRLYVRCTVCLAEFAIARVDAGSDVWSPSRSIVTVGWEEFLLVHTEHDGRLNVDLQVETDLLAGVALFNPSSKR